MCVQKIVGNCKSLVKTKYSFRGKSSHYVFQKVMSASTSASKHVLKEKICLLQYGKEYSVQENSSVIYTL